MRNFRHVYVPIFGGNIYCKRNTRAAYAAAIMREFGRESPSIGENTKATFEVYRKKGQDIGVIWLHPKAGNPQLWHECFHAAHRLLNDRGIWLTDSSEEVYAYFQEWLIKELS